MTTQAMTFVECKGAADRMFAYAVLVSQAAKSFVRCVYNLQKVDGAIANLLGVLTAERAERLNAAQREFLIHRLQEAHKYLVSFSRSREAGEMSKMPLPIIPGLITSLQNGTNDLGDVIENLVMMGDTDYQTFVNDCAADLGLDREADFAGMHD